MECLRSRFFLDWVGMIYVYGVMGWWKDVILLGERIDYVV